MKLLAFVGLLALALCFTLLALFGHILPRAWRSAAIITGALAFGAVPLGGCVFPSPSAAITSANNALASLANNDIPAACGIITVAEGYFNELKPAISAANQAAEAKAVTLITPICQNPPTNIAAAFQTLTSEWLIIQNATTTPAS